jgi:hypothetical protein
MRLPLRGTVRKWSLSQPPAEIYFGEEVKDALFVLPQARASTLTIAYISPRRAFVSMNITVVLT